MKSKGDKPIIVSLDSLIPIPRKIGRCPVCRKSITAEIDEWDAVPESTKLYRPGQFFLLSCETTRWTEEGESFEADKAHDERDPCDYPYGEVAMWFKHQTNYIACAEIVGGRWVDRNCPGKR